MRNPILDWEIGPIPWSEDFKFPFCDTCRVGTKKRFGYGLCACEARFQELCGYCEEDRECQCGYEEAVRYGWNECNCECSCEDEDDEDYEECEVCEGGGCICGAEDHPYQCDCKCECEIECNCRCKCKTVVFDHKSFNDWVVETCYRCTPNCFDESQLYLDHFPTISDVARLRCRVDIGPYEFGVRTVFEVFERKQPVRSISSALGVPFMFRPDKDQKFEVIKERSLVDIIQEVEGPDGKPRALRGRIRYDGPIHLPVLSKYDEYRRAGTPPKVWMSLTPMEVFTQNPGYEKAYGRVLIGGLGMGWLTNKVLRNPKVTQVDQVEIDTDIIDFFGTPLKEQFGGRIEFFNNDFWEYLNAAGTDHYDAILVDIWPSYDDARKDPLFHALRKSHPNVWGWGFNKVRNP